MDLTGKTLGNYQIIEEVGRGGMAVVYRAYQASLNRYVALKVLPPQLAFDSQFVERFLREARAAASLNHPNIVVVHDVGEQSGTYYIVMEFLQGRTLKQLIQQEGALQPQRAARILDQTANALDYAHRHGFVHRDVKPANIFIGEDDRVTLTDFGIAKAASEAQQLTRTGMLVGTPEYMSPEQAEGGVVDYRTDLYALGIVLYQMLTGQVPFHGATPHAVLHAVIYEPPIPPRQLKPDLPPGVGAVLLKSVAKQPEQRYQRGSEMSAALGAAIKGQRQAGGATVPPPPRRPRTDEGAKRSSRGASPLIWVLVGLAAVLMLVLGGLAILALGGSGGDEPAAVVTRVVIVPTATLDTRDVAPTPDDTATAGPLATASPAPTVPPLPPSDTPTPVDTSIPPSDTPPSPSDTPPSTNTPPPPTPTAPNPPTPTATTPTCSFDAQGAFSSLWQANRNKLGCPLYADPQSIQVAEQPFDNGHMFWRQDNDRIYVVYEAGGKTGSFEIFGDVWSEGDSDYSCAASPPPGRVQPVRGFGAAWCQLGGPSAQIGWGLADEVGKWAGNGDPMVQDFEQGLIFRDSDGTTKGLAYVLLSGGSFVRVAY